MERCNTEAPMRLAALSLIAFTAFATPSYQVMNLGGVGGGGDGAFAINNNSKTAGTAVTSNGTQLAFSATTNAAMLASSAAADAINNSGAVAGTQFGNDGPRATVWRDGVANAILEQDSVGLGLNDSGDVVG